MVIPQKKKKEKKKPKRFTTCTNIFNDNKIIILSRIDEKRKSDDESLRIQ